MKIHNERERAKMTQHSYDRYYTDKGRRAHRALGYTLILAFLVAVILAVSLLPHIVNGIRSFF